MGDPGALRKKGTNGTEAGTGPAPTLAPDANTVEAHLDTARSALDAALKAHDAMRWVPTREGREGGEGRCGRGGAGWWRRGGAGGGSATSGPVLLAPPLPLSFPLFLPHCRAPGPPTWTVPC